MRRTQYTVMLVCEGDAEEQFIRVIRDLYLPRHCGTSLSRKNAHGHGGRGALDLALQLKAMSEFDQYGVVIDTDRHWEEPDRRRAQQNGIVAIEHHPCIEAMLLKVGGHRCHRTTRENKAAFRQQYGSPANRYGVIERHFTRDMFDSARADIAGLECLLTLIRCPRP